MADYYTFPTSSDPEPIWWNGEPTDSPHSTAQGVFVCVDCPWKDGGHKDAFTHHVDTGHAVRGKHWPTTWPNAQFSDGDASGRRTERKSA